MSDTDPIVHEFLVESFENLEQVDRDLVELESAPGDRRRLDRIFRAIHTIKGTCGFLGMERLERLTHAGESLLALLRDGTLAADSTMASLLLELMDAVRTILTSIQTSGRDDGIPIEELAARLEAAAAQPPEPAPAPEPAPGTGPRLEKEAGRAGSAGGGGTRAPRISLEETEPQPGRPRDRSPERPPAPATRARSLAESYVRVDVRVLDRLMDMVGELVLTRNQLVEQIGTTSTAEGGNAIQQLDLLTSELQEGVMQTRMQPVSKVLGKLPRVVRDLAAGCGKRVRLTLEGQETELDRSLLEAIRDPLTHLVRNAVDHGIETPEEREAAGKPPEARVWIRAYHEAGQVTIELGDDGRGIDPEAVRRKAVDRGLITAEQAARLGPDETFGLLFLPGFSTADEVTNLSGRGVGLDVVRDHITRVNGLVELDSTPGQGTVFRLRIPLTLAIVPAVVVVAGGQRFTIPQASVLELVRLDLADGKERVERVHGAPVYRLRGALLPLVELRRELELPQGGASDSLTIVVLEAGERRFGLVVDSVLDTQEIVVKPLGPLLEVIPIYAGATVMGDGRVALILDVLGLAQRAHVVAEGTERRLSEDDKPEKDGTEAERLLVFTSPDDGRMAVHLDRVVRLERIPVSAVETIGSGRAIQYRGDILPLVWVFDHLPERRRVPRGGIDQDREALDVVVYAYQGQAVGLVVGPVIDIVEERITVRRPASREGVKECVVVRERVTELLDAEAVLARAEIPLAPASGGAGA